MTINTNLKYIYFVDKIDVATLKMDIGKAHIVHLWDIALTYNGQIVLRPASNLQRQ